MNLKLKAKIIEKGLSIADVAVRSGINYDTLNRKLHGKTEFNRSEINALREVLELTDMELISIFFGLDLH